MVVMSKLLKFFLCFVMMAFVIGSPRSGYYSDIMDAIAGETFIIRTWSLNDGTVSISVKVGSTTRFSAFLHGNDSNITTVQNDRLMMKYGSNTQEVSLVFDKVRREDEGLYQVEESSYRLKPFPLQSEHDAYQRKDGRWNFQLNVHDPGEVKSVNIGENIIMEFIKSSKVSTLYLYDQLVALWTSTACSIETDSHFYGRLRCTSDELSTKRMVTIANVTQRDAGLYKIEADGRENRRYFLNITDKPTFANVRGNVTISWYYSQQGMSRTLRIIHPKEGVMMILPSTNVPQINPNFQRRLLYRGDVSRSYMSFSLLNVEQSDTGLYTIETVHGNTITGGKQLIVEATVTFVATVSASEFNDRHSSTVSLRNTTEPNSPEDQSMSSAVCVPIYVIPVVFVTVVVILLMICCQVWIHRRNKYGLETERRLSLVGRESDPYLTPIPVEGPMAIPPRGHGSTSHLIYQSNNAQITQSVQFDSNMQLFCRTDTLGMDGYEMVDISHNNDQQNTSYPEEIISESAETSTTPFQDTFGYLTVQA